MKPTDNLVMSYGSLIMAGQTSSDFGTYTLALLAVIHFVFYVYKVTEEL